MTEQDTYRTISKASKEILYKDKNSKFFGYAFPITSEETAKDHIENLKKTHRSAGHFCYAYQIGTKEQDLIYRANDDGEPNNSAGMPIYGQIQSFEVTNVLIVIVRYFGGIKLGVGGLISAYRTSAQLALEAAKIVTRTMNVNFQISFEYKHMNKVMRIIKEKNLNIVNQILELDCKIFISVRLKDSEEISDIFKNLQDIKIEILND